MTPLNLPLSMRYRLPWEPVPWKRAGANLSKRVFFDQQRQDKLVYGIELARQHAGERKLIGPLHLDIVFFLPVNVSHARRRPHPLSNEINNERFHYFRADLDNYLKFCLDAMNDTGVIFQDDCQVAYITAKKILGDPPRTELILSEIR